ncbi:MAG: serine/threonine protein kinase [Planctomycetaceae bacterium]|nr:serine/threonine protein kinase [Planctomycetaceae bacterium]
MQHNLTTCPHDELLLASLLDFEPASSEIDVHVEHCLECQIRLGELADQQIADPWQQLIREVTCSGSNHTTPREAVISKEPHLFPTLPGYQVIEEIGRGGMGIVYRAIDLKLDREVAIKMLLGGAASSLEQRERIRVEARSLGRLRHPGVVSVYGMGEYAGAPFLCLELVHGPGLDQFLKTVTISPRTAARLLEQIARAVAYAHSNGVLHRDLKPANVLLKEVHQHAEGALAIDKKSWQVKLTDFGLARCLDATQLTLHPRLMGTPSYLAPELAEGETATTASDVYGLGAVLYELLTGTPPHHGESSAKTLHKLLREPLVPPSKRNSQIPRDLETICLKCLASCSSARYASAAELADDLQRWLEHRPILARPVGTFEQFTSWIRRHPKATVSVGAALAILSGWVISATVLWQQAEAHRITAEGMLSERNRQLARSEANLVTAMQAIDSVLGWDGKEGTLVFASDASTLDQTLHPQALELYEQLLESNPDDERLQFRTAVLLQSVSQLDVRENDDISAWQRRIFAQEIFSRLQRRHPRNPAYHWGLGRTSWGLRSWSDSEAEKRDLTETAIHHMREAIRLSPDEPVYRSELGGFANTIAAGLVADRRFDEATDMFQLIDDEVIPAYTSTPDDINLCRIYLETMFTRSTWFRETGSPADGLKLMEESVDVALFLSETHPHVRTGLYHLTMARQRGGNLLIILGRYDEAIDWLQQSLELWDQVFERFGHTKNYNENYEFTIEQLRLAESLLVDESS